MIERVADLLSDPRLHLDADDIADALWLALQIEAITPDQGAHEQPAPTDGDDTTDLKPPPQPPDTQPDTKTTPQEEESNGNLYPSSGQQQRDDPDDMRGVPFRTPAASALPAGREIAKALRPLMRRYPSRTQAVFDEQATVQKIADERIAWIGGRRSRVSGLWHIQLQPARERWFDVELVADVGASMVLWRQSIAEFHHLLLRHGAFRRVRAWSLNTDINEGQPALHPGLGDTATRQPPRSRQELLAPGGRRLILVVTDSVSPGWHAGAVTDLLSFWGAHHPIALVQVLPERLWSGSALRAASAIQMQSLGPDVANKRLAYTFQSPMDRLLMRRRPPAQQSSRLPVPVLTLDGDQVAAWASLVTGTGTTPANGFLLTSTPDASMPIPDEDEQPADTLSPEQLVDDFREYASPEAFRLAQFLAAAPLSLPVIRLVQRTMMPKARQGHLAEVFLSGLLRRRTPAEADVHPEYVWYDFLTGVREVLRQGLSLYEDALVMERVTEYVREHYGLPQDFQALLFDTDAVDGLALDPHLLPFAEVVAELQERMGFPHQRGLRGNQGTSEQKPMPEPPAEPVLESVSRGPLVLLSYSQFDEGALSQFRDELRRTLAFVSDGNVNIFHQGDIQIGQSLQERITEVLNEAKVLVVVLTPIFFADQRCLRILRKFLEREQELGQRNLILPILYQTVKFPDDPLGHELAQRAWLDWRPLRGRDFSDPAMRRMLERMSHRLVDMVYKPQEVELFTFPPVGTTAHEPRTLDWSNVFMTRPTIENVWQDVMLPDLEHLRRDVGTNRVQHMLLYPRLHSGFGFGVGATFSRAMRLTVEQPFPNAGVQMWASDTPPAEDVRIKMGSADLDTWLDQLTTGPTSIELSISRNVNAGVTTYLQTLDVIESWHRLQITPIDGPSFAAVPNNAHATALANQIGDIIRRVRDQTPGSILHLFASLPLGLEILIGLQLNACKPIQCYGYDNSTGAYYPAYLLA